jgi:hypothetical protein
MLMLALVSIPTAAAGTGNGRGPAKPLPPDQALALINAAPTVDLSAASAVSKGDALAAMTAPGAATTVLGDYGSAGAAVAAATGCAASVAHVSWGTWPYDHTIYENTYWCAVYGDHITSYSTTVTTDQTLCTRQNTDHFTYSGGVNYSWVVVQANATWTCPIIGFIPYSVGGWVRTSYNAWGNDAIVDHS